MSLYLFRILIDGHVVLQGSPIQHRIVISVINFYFNNHIKHINSNVSDKYNITLKKLFGRYHNLTLPYRVSVTTMANDICRP